MITWFLLVLRTLSGTARSHLSLSAENAILRQQLDVLQRGRPRPLLRPTDRVMWIWLARHWSRWRYALVLIQPATVLKWHREGYRRYWRRRSGGPGRPRTPRNHISLIRRISSDNPGWGEDRIALELKAKLGVEHAPSTIRRYMVTVTREGTGRPVSSTWRTFLAGHANELSTMDLTWLKQRIREATPFDSGPRFMVHDNDGIFGQFARRRPGKSGKSYRSALDLWLGEVLNIKGVPIPYGAPNAAAHLERFMGSLRRECLAHPVLDGLHHDYRRALADSPPSSELPADRSFGITDPDRSRPFLPCWAFPSAGFELPLANPI